MSKKQVTSTEFQNRAGRYLEQSAKRPIFITRYGQPVRVLLDIDEYERLKRYDTRKALYPHELSDELKAEFEQGYQGEATSELEKLIRQTVSFEPKPGLIIRFDFLWKEEESAGHTDGLKDRPCAIILTTKPKEGGTRDVVLCPITHSPPQKGESAIEIPAKLARHLKLDDGRSWIKTHQINTVEWEQNRLPFGVVPAHKGQWVFGQLPQSIGKQVFEQVKANIDRKHLRNVRR